MKQTAVEWLISELNTWQAITDEDTNQVLNTVRKLVEQAKEMEKQQIVNAYNQGSLDSGYMPYKYYEETYKSDKQ